MEFTQAMRDETNARWNLMQVRTEKKGDVQWCANQITKNKARYENVAALVGYPWWFIAIIHGMECSFSFSKWLANGDSISAPTVRVPKGLKCDGTWEDGARVTIQHEWQSKQNLSTIADVLWAFERFNGTGYRNRNKPSQYVWSFTNIEQPGRYVSDGVWSDTAMSGQVGCAAMLSALIDAGQVSFGEEKPQLPADERANWLEIYRIEEGGNVSTGCVAWEDGKVIATWDGRNKRAFFDFTNRFVNAGSILTAPASKAWPTNTHVTVPPTSVNLMEKLMALADAEGKKKLVYTDESCEAEKYLRPWRDELGAPHARFAWCSAFCCWCLTQVKIQIDFTPNHDPGLTLAYVPTFKLWAQQEKCFITANPRRGDIIIFGQPNKEPIHIGFVTEIKDGKIFCTEGNNQNATIYHIDRTNFGIQGFVRIFDAAGKLVETPGLYT